VSYQNFDTAEEEKQCPLARSTLRHSILSQPQPALLCALARNNAKHKPLFFNLLRTLRTNRPTLFPAYSFSFQ
jgi:hypothetical protein